MAIIKKKNPTTGEWEIFSATTALEMPILDIGNNFTSNNVEGALREIANKNRETTAKVEAHSTTIQAHSTTIQEHSSTLQSHDATLQTHTEEIEWLKVNGGGGGGGTSAPTITSKFADGTIVQKDEEVKIPIFFSSPNQGNGIAYIVIDGIEVASVEGIKQGNNTINIGKLPNLKNNVAIYVKDRANMLSNQLEWLIICGGIDLEINFDDKADYEVTDNILMQFTITSASTEPIIMHMKIDYDTYEVPCNQGVNEYLFSNLGVGVHKIEFYVTSGEYVSQTVIYNIVVVSSSSLFVSSTFEGGQFINGNPIAIDYRISKASDEYFTVKLYLDNELQKTLSVQAGTYYWTLNEYSIGNHTIRIEVTSGYNEEFIIEKQFEVIAGEYTPLKITEAGLVYRLSAKGRTNQDSDRDNPRDNSGNGVSAKLHNFNWYTNGWIDDELVCDSNAYVEIDCYPWVENAIYGSTIEIQFTGLDIGFNEARIFDYTDVETPYKGVYIDLEETTMKSLANTGKVNIDKDVETTISFVIDRKNKFGKIYVDGICSRAFSLSDTGSGTSAVREDFTHTQKIYLNSRKGLDKFGACKIKDIRIYSRTLSDDEIVKNIIAQVTNLDAQERLYKLNYENTTLPVIRMYGDTTNMTLETPVTMRVKYTSPNEDKYGQSFDLPYCTVNWQGTSSLQYVLKNFTVRLKDENMADYYYSPYPNGVLENTYCLKCD
ncbi:sialidase domain-containing protein [Clostridium sp.]|uniref:sialidase domain-containing protein n=1 Tax=Clostridium sp. TaxID=1506 RepID=UPI0025B7B2D1|nr:sialidase domain-containing protein [Clostridium sp.]